MDNSSNLPSGFRWLIDPKRSQVGYWLIYGMGALQVMGAATIFWYSAEVLEGLLGVVLLLLGFLFLAVARTLGQAKGGIGYDSSKKELVLYGCGGKDRFTIPGNRIVGLRVDRRQEFWGNDKEPTFVTSLCVMLNDGVGVLLLEHVAHEEIRESAHLIQEVTGIPILPDGKELLAETASPSMASGKGPFVFHTGVHWGLSLPLGLLALFSLVSGVLLFAGVAVTGVVGFIFGPVFLFLGLIVGGLWIFKALGKEEVTVGSPLTRSYEFMGHIFGKKTLPLDSEETFVRLRTRGSHGLSLEIVSGGRMFILGSGTNLQGRTPPDRLLQLGASIQRHRLRKP